MSPNIEPIRPQKIASKIHGVRQGRSYAKHQCPSSSSPRSQTSSDLEISLVLELTAQTTPGDVGNALVVLCVPYGAQEEVENTDVDIVNGVDPAKLSAVNRVPELGVGIEGESVPRVSPTGEERTEGFASMLHTTFEGGAFQALGRCRSVSCHATL